jgi:hypothetical protein
MLGWHVSVYRLEGVDLPFPNLLSPDASRQQLLRDAASSRGTRIAVWQAGVDGLRWIDNLVKNGQAIALPGNGYPFHFFAPARHLLTPISEGPPQANAVWRHDPGDILTSKWEGRTTIDQEAVARCSPDEWLLVEAWDES